MIGYWLRHRFIVSLFYCVVIAIIVGALFVYPFIREGAYNYNAQSIYTNSGLDFIAPEPSFSQVEILEGLHGIDKIFPYYLTKVQVDVNGNKRETTILLSDWIQNKEITAYSDKRLIEKSAKECSNPIYVDWQFCHDVEVGLGDCISVSIAGETMEFQVAAIYEPNTLYDGGAILAGIDGETKAMIAAKSLNNGYSGMYVKASDYDECKEYLKSVYRPLGRLKSRTLFEDDSQFQTHYEAIMSNGYANEITDFQSKRKDVLPETNPLMLWIGAGLSAVLIVVINVVMSRRGCEVGYFRNYCVPKGKAIKPYYEISFFFEIIFCIGSCIASVIFLIAKADYYISKEAFEYKMAVIPGAVILAEFICLIYNRTIAKRTGK